MVRIDNSNMTTLRQQVVEFYKDIAPESYHLEDAAFILQLRSAEELNAYLKVVKSLLQEGVLFSKDGEYICYQEMERHTKKKIGTTYEGIYKNYGKGYGFLIRMEEEDIYISDTNRKGALNNDKVEVALLSKGTTHRSLEGRVVRIIERANHIIVGTLDRQKRFAFVTPDDERLGSDIHIPLDDALDAQSGAKVQVEIVKWPKHTENPEGRVLRVLGYMGDKGLDIDMILAKHNLLLSFPKEVINAANALPREIVASNKRMDLRDEPTITIDGADAKDLDDAVSLTILSSGNYRLGVHIADVSHYVKSMGDIDKEAYRRGTSVYVVDRVIPMLPEVLSNDLCSLNAGVDRYAMSCIMDISPTGKVLHSKIGPSIIHVNRRCTYREVYQALREDIIHPDLQEYIPLLKMLESLGMILIKRRHTEGALDFNFPEYRILLNEDGQPTRIVKRDRTIAEEIIEQCMLLANETVATFLYNRNPIAIYRIHEEPKQEKVENLAMVMRYLGREMILPETISSQFLQEFLQLVAGTEVEEVAQLMMLRSMQQAKYSAENKGHFGLASSCYTHFTSPIRRYPDLMVHRLIKMYLHWEDGYCDRDGKESYLVEASAQASVREQLAVTVEREVESLKKTEYMIPFLGHTLIGKVSNITSFGMFISLDNGVEGLVPIDSMTDDYYVFEEEHFVLVGRRRGKIYHLGQEVEVTVVRVDLQKRQIDFALGHAKVELREDKVKRKKAHSQKKGILKKRLAKARKGKYGKKK